MIARALICVLLIFSVSSTARVQTINISPGQDISQAGRQHYDTVKQALHKQALQFGKTALFDTLSKSLQEHPLHPYLAYADLRQRLRVDSASVSMAEVRHFLNRYTDTPLRSRLLHAWIEYLARQKRWHTLLEDFQDNNDTSLNCLKRQAFLALGRIDEALGDIESIWMSAKSQPESCDPLFAAWKQQGGFTQARLWQRFVLAISADQVLLARYLQKQISGPKQSLAALWLQVHAEPRKILHQRLFDSSEPATQAILLHGLKRWIQRDSVSAAPALDTIKKRYALPVSPELSALEKRLAVYLAARGDPDAKRRLDAIDSEHVDEAVHAWRVRTVLRDADWAAVRQEINRMPLPLRETLQWQYWLARALHGSGDEETAREIFAKLAARRDYYGFLAADHAQLPYQMEHQPLAVDNDLLNRIQLMPGIRRAQALLVLGDANNARREWTFALRSAGRKLLAGAAEIAHRWNWHDQAIATLARANLWNDIEIRFPLPYQTESYQFAKLQRIDPAWVYALMRRESLFRADVGSAAGALGLMQIMPATGQRIAQELKLKWDSRLDLLKPELNIRFGTYYLRQNLNKLQHSLLLATAAYNAGPHRVMNWLPRTKSIDADIWAEVIPFSETRKYVKRVLEYTAVYEHRLGLPPTRLQKHMPPVLPAGDD